MQLCIITARHQIYRAEKHIITQSSKNIRSSEWTSLTMWSLSHLKSVHTRRPPFIFHTSTNGEPYSLLDFLMISFSSISSRVSFNFYK